MSNSTHNGSDAQLTSFSVDLLSEEFSAQDKLNQEFIKKQLQSIPFAFVLLPKIPITDYIIFPNGEGLLLILTSENWVSFVETYQLILHGMNHS